MPAKLIAAIGFLLTTAFTISFKPVDTWQSKFIKQNKDGSLQYAADEKGNIIPDFSLVGYYAGDKEIANVAVVKTVTASADAEKQIQDAIDELSKQPLNANGLRGAILLKKGTYTIPGQIKIQASGIVLRGEGDETKLVAAGTVNRPLINVSGNGNVKEINGTRTKIIQDYVAVGSKSFRVESANGFKAGDRIILYRPGTDQWIKDLKMDQIEARGGTKQWQPNEYNLQYERVITKIEGNTIFIDNPVVMEMESKYGGGEIYKYSFDGRISNVGIENLYCESEYLTDTSENHSWDAVHFDKIENGWARNVTAKYFAYSCVHLSLWAKNISVLDCNCSDHKSVITGGRRYSFCNEGQQNLFINCHAADGRHDFVTQARTCGPNVFYNCTAKRTHADIGPHHRWSSGTLYDNIITDGEINIQDRGNYGSGHGWVGVTQILWNCTVKRATVQSPWVNGKNYCIGLKGEKAAGRFKDRPDGEWEGQNKQGLQPASLYMAQLKARK
ncbi:MAG TPA: hypothetical protein VGQ09_19450 [Chitinophagaceae bacterium]|nr:hypothetical protein [Chitinophagaceae bacterium]